MAAAGDVPQDWARPVVHWEIEARDPELIRAFYAELFGWSIGDGPIMTVAPGIGGPESGVGGHIRGSDSSRVNLYVQVRDLRTSLEQAVSLGGSVSLEPFDVPGGASLAGIKDPEGNPLMLVQQ
jgi:predicted enzyme related to lactoylglutathione lyase